MRILALETSGHSGSVAALDGARLLVEHELTAGQRSAQSLTPTIAAVCRAIGWQPGEVQLVAVTVGPGSFTGLRIGVSTAKALAYALATPLLGINTLEVIMRQAPAGLPRLQAVMDAQRDELFVGVGGSASDFQGAARSALKTQVIQSADWLASLETGAWVTGPGLARLVDRLPPQVRVVDRGLWAPRAATVGGLAWERFSAGQRDDLFQLVPQYFRRTAAEEQWERLHPE